MNIHIVIYYPMRELS